MTASSKLALLSSMAGSLVLAVLLYARSLSGGDVRAAPLSGAEQRIRLASRTELADAVPDSARTRGAGESTLVDINGACTDMRGAPVFEAGMSLRLYGPSRQVVSVPIKPGGTFRAPVLESGAWRIECQARGYHHAPFSVDAHETETAVDVVLERVRVLDVSLCDAYGGPLVGALDPAVRDCIDEFVPRVRGDAWQLYERPQWLAKGSDGRLSLLEGTPLDVEVLCAGARVETRAHVNDLGVLEIRLDSAQSRQRIALIEVRVLAQGTRTPLEGAVVSLVCDAGTTRSARTDTAGHAELASLRGGRLTVACSGYEATECTVEIQATQANGLREIELVPRASPRTH